MREISVQLLGLSVNNRRTSVQDEAIGRRLFSLRRQGGAPKSAPATLN